MGMYTDFALRFSILKDDKDFDLIMSVIEHMTDIDIDEPPILPNHFLFRTSRWGMMAKSGRSFIRNVNYQDDVEFMLIGEFKNYEDEIAHFINWITPHIYCGLTGYSHYEGSEHTVPYFVESAE